MTSSRTRGWLCAPVGAGKLFLCILMMAACAEQPAPQSSQHQTADSIAVSTAATQPAPDLSSIHFGMLNEEGNLYFYIDTLPLSSTGRADVIDAFKVGTRWHVYIPGENSDTARIMLLGDSAVGARCEANASGLWARIDDFLPAGTSHRTVLVSNRLHPHLRIKAPIENVPEHIGRVMSSWRDSLIALLPNRDNLLTPLNHPGPHRGVLAGNFRKRGSTEYLMWEWWEPWGDGQWGSVALVSEDGKTITTLERSPPDRGRFSITPSGAVDMDGDGVDEVIVSVNNYDSSIDEIRSIRGDSMSVLLRRQWCHYE